MHAKDIRWKQRFQNLKRAYAQLKDATFRCNKLNRLEQEGLVKRFEYTFELAWRTLKDYLDAQGVGADFPRAVIKAAFRQT